MEKVKKMLPKFCGFLFFGMMGTFVSAQKISYQVNSQTGALQTLSIANDPQKMNWLVATDGSQYRWVKENYGWGLGYATQVKGNRKEKVSWEVPVEIKQEGNEVVYMAGDIRICVKRKMVGDELVEEYTFRNQGEDEVVLVDIGVYTPFNDNYPGSRTCINARTNTHIWEGENAAYINALRMGGYAPHLGLVLTKGAVKSYEIWERGRDKGNSHTRGIITLNLPDLQLMPGKEYSISWCLFAHKGIDDFRQKLLEKGSVFVSCNKYVFEKGEKAFIELAAENSIQKCVLKKQDIHIPMKKRGNLWIAEVKMDQLGENRFDMGRGNKRT